jgi:hypothetical protein
VHLAQVGEADADEGVASDVAGVVRERSGVLDAEGHGPRRHGRGEPRDAVLDGDAVGDVDAQQLGAAEVRLGVRLAVLDLVARHDGVERVVADRVDHELGHPADRHGDERGRDTGLAELREQLAGATPASGRAARSARAPGRHGTCSAQRDSTSVVSRSMISSAGRSTPCCCSTAAECQRPEPIRVSPRAFVQVPPKEATSSTWESNQ